MASGTRTRYDTTRMTSQTATVWLSRLFWNLEMRAISRGWGEMDAWEAGDSCALMTCLRGVQITEQGSQKRLLHLALSE